MTGLISSARFTMQKEKGYNLFCGSLVTFGLHKAEAKIGNLVRFHVLIQLGRLTDTAKARRKKPQMAKLVSENVEGDKSHTHSLARTEGEDEKKWYLLCVLKP